MSTPTVATVARCIFPDNKAVLVAYDASGDFLLGIGYNPKSAVAWAGKDVSAADRRTMARKVAERYTEDSCASRNTGTCPDS